MATKTAQQIARTGNYYKHNGGTIENMRAGLQDGTLTIYPQKYAAARYVAAIIVGDSFVRVWECSHDHPNKTRALECAQVQVDAITA